MSANYVAQDTHSMQVVVISVRVHAKHAQPADAHSAYHHSTQLPTLTAHVLSATSPTVLTVQLMEHYVQHVKTGMIYLQQIQLVQRIALTTVIPAIIAHPAIHVPNIITSILMEFVLDA